MLKLKLSPKVSLILQTSLTVILALMLVGGGAVGGYLYRGVADQQAGLVSRANPAQVDMGLFWDAWGIIDSRFYGGANTDKQVQGAIAGMVGGLGDPYTVYMPPSVSKLFKSDLAGSFGGIGAELESKNGLITVVAPLQNTPAERANLKAGDIITKIDGQLTADMVFNDAIDKIRGAKGTDVVLTIARAGADKQFDLTLTRETIVIKSVVAEDLTKNGSSYRYIKINMFGDDTSGLLQAELEAAVQAGKKGVLLDLRNDPGGLLDKAIQSIGMVIAEKPSSTESNLQSRVAVQEQHKDGSVSLFRSTNPAVAPSLPMVVLINGGSASASEIFAGAMKDYQRAQLVGEKSFGKGSVQELKDLKNGGSVKVTIAHWLTPLGKEINGKGVEPDVAVSLAEGEKLSTTDTQAKKGLELLP